MGFATKGYTFCLLRDMALQSIRNCMKVIDDEDFTTHMKRIHQVLTRCQKYGITLTKDKFIVATPSTYFCIYILNSDGISAYADKSAESHTSPKPANLTDLRSFLGLVNQLAEFTPDIATTVQPLRPLMSPKRPISH